MSKKKPVPELRFPEFEEDWKKYKLSELFSISAGGDIDSNKVKPEPDEVYKYPVYANAEKKKGLYGYSSEYKIEPNVITVAGRGVNVGITHVRDHRFYPIVRLLVLNPKISLSIHFFEYQINRINIFLESTGVPQLTAPQISSYKVASTSIAEQEKIASFLGAIDTRLTQLRRKHKLLQTYKRGVMQKIFSQEIRFPEFKNDWIYSTLGKVTKYTKGFAFKSEDYLDNGIRIIRASDLDNQRIRQENQKVCVSEEFAENDKIKKYTVYKGNIIISTVGSKPELRSSAVGRGVYVCSDSEGLLNQNLLKFENIEDVNNRFLFAQINTSRYVDYISSIQRGNANQSNITVKDLLDYQIFITSLEEQEKIADFLTAIDRKIEAVAQQIDRTKQFKKGLLQKMFV